MPYTPTDWKLGKFVCSRCEKQKKRHDFKYNVQEADVCIACKADDEAARLAEQISKRKAERKYKDKNAQRKAAAKLGGRARGRQMKEDAKQRTKLKKDLEKKVQRKAAAIADLRDPVSMAEHELASRELARRSLIHYTERGMPNYEAGWVHEDIARRLEKFMRDVEEQKSPRLMLWVPPRHGKSELSSTQFPSWVLGHHPNWEFMNVSASLELPLGFSRKVRAQLRSDEYHKLFPDTYLSKDSQGAENWKTTKGGGFRASGIGGLITGMGAHILLVDDPVKDQADADSDTARDALWNWFGPTAYSRIAPGGGCLVIQTRWHDDDLSGRLERQMREELSENEAQRAEAKYLIRHAATAEERNEAQRMLNHYNEEWKSIDKWEIVKYPAIATHDEYLNLQTGRITDGAHVSEKVLKSNYRKLRTKGDALHPQRWSKIELMRRKRILQPRHWSALYQQNPTPDEGAYFTSDTFRTRITLPEHGEMYKFCAWDLAIGQKQGNDYTVGVVGALDWDDRIWILDMIRGRFMISQIAQLVVDTHVRYDAQMTGIEKGQLELALYPELKRYMKKNRKYIALAEGEDALRPITDKMVRARPLQGRMQQGTVLFPADQPWFEEHLKAEMLRFPNGVHDDIVDAMAWLVRMTTGVSSPRNPSDKHRGRGRIKSWRDRLKGNARKDFMAR